MKVHTPDMILIMIQKPHILLCSRYLIIGLAVDIIYAKWNLFPIFLLFTDANDRFSNVTSIFNFLLFNSS